MNATCSHPTAALTLETIGSSRPWVARITGPDPRYGLAREFVRGATDYSRANSVRSRGVRTFYALPDGLYEINSPETWKRTERYFALIRQGEMERVDAATALQAAAA